MLQKDIIENMIRFTKPISVIGLVPDGICDATEIESECIAIVEDGSTSVLCFKELQKKFRYDSKKAARNGKMGTAFLQPETSLQDSVNHEHRITNT